MKVLRKGANLPDKKSKQRSARLLEVPAKIIKNPYLVRKVQKFEIQEVLRFEIRFRMQVPEKGSR